jgi:uncharacterized membrane protein
MSNRWLARLVLVALICVVVANVTEWIFGAFQVAGAALGGLAAAALTWACRNQAMKGVEKSARYRLWMAVPLVLFTVVPIAVRVVQFVTADSSSMLLSFANVLAFAISFAAPVAVLGVVYGVLARRE